MLADLTGLYSDFLVAPALLELRETPSAAQNRVGGGRGLMGRDLHLAFFLCLPCKTKGLTTNSSI